MVKNINNSKQNKKAANHGTRYGIAGIINSDRTLPKGQFFIKKLAKEMIKFYNETDAVALEDFALLKRMPPKEFFEFCHSDPILSNALSFVKMMLSDKLWFYFERGRISSSLAVKISSQIAEDNKTKNTVNIN